MLLDPAQATSSVGAPLYANCYRAGKDVACVKPWWVIAIAIPGMVFGAEAEPGEIVGQVDYLLGRETALAMCSCIDTLPSAIWLEVDAQLELAAVRPAACGRQDR